MRRAVIVFTVLAFATTVRAAEVVPREATIRRSVASGTELRVRTYASFHRDCKAMPPPRVVVRTQPAHGTVDLRAAPVTVSIIREGVQDCSGQTYPGTGVYYLPAPGFHGTDQFDYDIIDERGTDHDTAIIQVK